MSASHHADYEEACRLFQEGHLQPCRTVAESLISQLSRVELKGNDSTAVHKLFSNALLLVSNVYSAVGPSAESDRLLATCYGYVKEHIPVDSHNIALATILYNRAVIRLEWERLDPSSAPRKAVVDAQNYLTEAENRLVNVLGLPRLLLADVLHCHGVCHHMLGLDYMAAVECYRRSMEIRRHFGDVHGISDLKTALTMEHIAHIYRLWGKQVEALTLLGSVLEARREALGSQNALYASTLLAYGVLALELGKKKAARRALKEAEAVHRDIYPESDWRVAEVGLWLSQLS